MEKGHAYCHDPSHDDTLPSLRSQIAPFISSHERPRSRGKQSISTASRSARCRLVGLSNASRISPVPVHNCHRTEASPRMSMNWGYRKYCFGRHTVRAQRHIGARGRNRNRVVLAYGHGWRAEGPEGSPGRVRREIVLITFTSCSHRETSWPASDGAHTEARTLVSRQECQRLRCHHRQQVGRLCIDSGREAQR